MPQAKKGRERLLRGWSQPHVVARIREASHPLLRGQNRAEKVCPVSGLLGPEGRMRSPVESGQEAGGSGLGEMKSHRCHDTGGLDAAIVGWPQDRSSTRNALLASLWQAWRVAEVL